MADLGSERDSESESGSEGPVWSFVLPHHALEAPLRSLGALKHAKNEGSSVCDILT